MGARGEFLVGQPELRRLLLEALVVAQGGGAVGAQDRWRVTVVKPGPNDGANWRLRIAPPRGSADPVRRESTGTTDRALALDMAQAKAAEMNARAQDGPRVLDILDRYIVLLDSQHTPDGTMGTYRQARAHLAATLPDSRESDLARGFAERLYQALLERNLRPSTARARVQKVAAAWRWARRQGLVTAPWVQPPRPKARRQARGLRTDKRPYTPRESAAVIAALPQHHRPVSEFLAQTGCRVGEAVALDVGDLVRDRAGWWAEIADAKSHEPRRVPLLPALVGLLDLQRPETAPLFLGVRGSRLSASVLLHAVVRVIEALGLRRQVGPESALASWALDLHSWRRSFVADCSRSGVPRPIAARIVGHALQGVHDGYQRHATGDDLHGAIMHLVAWRAAQVDPHQQRLDFDAARGYNPRVLKVAAGRGWSPTAGSSRPTSGLGRSHTNRIRRRSHTTHLIDVNSGRGGLVSP